MLNLIVMYSSNIEVSKAFYENVGLTFEKHKHGNGPEHYAATDKQGSVIEIYPTNGVPVNHLKPGDVAVGFGVPSITDFLLKIGFSGDQSHIFGSVKMVVAPRQTEFGFWCVMRDPDGRSLHLTEKQ